MIVGVLGIRLKEKGYKIGDLAERANIPYDKICRYCRASDRSYGKPEVWKIIDECLIDMGVEWDGSSVLLENRMI